MRNKVKREEEKSKRGGEEIKKGENDMGKQRGSGTG